MSNTPRIKDFDEFAKVHAFLLAASGLPTNLYRRLYAKLASETYDGGDFFSVEPCEGGRQRRLLLSAESLSKESDLFLVDHAWSFRLSDALKQLREVPGLAERMAALMCVDLDKKGETEDAENEEIDPSERHNKIAFQIVEKEMCTVKESGKEAVTWLEFEELGIDDEMLRALDLSTKFPNLVALNLWGNKLRNADIVVQEVTKCKNLKALWLNENPVLDSCSDSIEKSITEALPALEIYNSHITTKFGSWALSFCGGIFGPDNFDVSMDNSATLSGITSLDLSNRCIHKLPETFSPYALPSLSQLNVRGNPLDQVQAGEVLKVLGSFTCLKELETDIPGPLGNSAVEIVKSLPNLTTLNGVSTPDIVESGKHVVDTALVSRLPEWEPMEPFPERVVSAMWLYLMTYRLADEEKIDETPVWYVMDELGSALRHSDNANFRVSPFLFMPDGQLTSAISYSVLWPTQDVRQGEECTRDYLFGVGEDKHRSARLTAWFHTPENYFIQEFRKYVQELESKALSPPKDLGGDTKPVTRSIYPNDGHPLRVFTDIPHVEDFLSRPEFILTNEPKDADIVWTSLQVDAELKKALDLNDNQYTNQFPFEACLVMKHHLAETIHKAQGSPEWLQPTYNLETELSQIIGDYFLRKREGLDNLWILKPWNMARTIDTTVSGDLSAIIRMMETGPKICQKYIERPALFGGRKFDLRYIVLVRSMHPLEIFLSDVFWVRLANNQYTLEKNSFFEYETHFTVMNYIGKLTHKNTPDFVKEFEEEHQVKWMEIHDRIRKMIRCIFESAASVQPEMHNPRSRAIYGIDVMLDNLFMPKLLEVTYCPDCTRACNYDTEAILRNKALVKGRDFFNNVFGCLFLGESTNVTQI